MRLSKSSEFTIIKLDFDLSLKYFFQYFTIEEFLKVKRQQAEALGLHVISIKWEKSRSHFHVLMKVKGYIPTKDLFKYQFLLGDDNSRCNYNFFRLNVFGERARYLNVLFTRKQKYKKLGDIFKRVKK